MRTRWSIAGAAFVLCFGTALTAEAQETKTPLPTPLTEPEVAPAKAEFDAINKEMRAAQNEWRKVYAARPKGEEAKGWTAPPRAELEFIPRFVAGAQKYAGTEDAVQYLVTVAGLGRSFDKDAGAAAIETLASDHAHSDQLAGLTFTLVYGAYSYGEDPVIGAATQIAARTPHADVKSAMLYARASIVQRRGPKDEQESQAAVADLRAAIEAAPDSRYAGLAKGSIFELENLQIGMVAPDIAGDDLDGVAFQLSDYRGKVVVLDFWGDW